MNNGLKRMLVLGMTACLAASSLAGCSSKSKGMDPTAAIATLDGTEVPAGVLNFLFRYQQAQFETTYGSFLKSYYGDDIWNSDLSGSGTAYGDTFKSEMVTTLEKMLLCETHMSDYGVELTEDETAAIKTAAADFMAANSEEVLTKMSATEETVERVMTLYTIQNKMETQMSADVDTEVSDEEAAQRTVSYVRFSPIEETEADTAEGSTEAATDTAEVSTEGATDTAEVSTEAETAVTEVSSEASVTEADSVKTEAADTEAETQVTEAVTESGSEAATEAAATEAAEEASTESISEDASEAETETETEDAATIAAKAEAQARAEAFLETAKTAEDFAAAATEVTEADTNATTSSFTFGADDTYPDTAIITATEGLEDNTLVQEVIYANSAYYVLHVDDAFDETATESKKTEIVDQRKQDAITALYDEWMEGVEFITDEDLLAEITFDYSLSMETEAATEEVSEAATEASTEAVSEAATEASTEAVSEAAAEASTEAVSEAATEASTEAVSEAATEAAAK